MSDFEVMPVGTRDTMRAAAKLLRSEADRLKPQRGKLCRTMAVNLDRLLEQSGVDLMAKRP